MQGILECMNGERELSVSTHTFIHALGVGYTLISSQLDLSKTMNNNL